MERNAVLDQVHLKVLLVVNRTPTWNVTIDRRLGPTRSRTQPMPHPTQLSSRHLISSADRKPGLVHEVDPAEPNLGLRRDDGPVLCLAFCPIRQGPASTVALGNRSLYRPTQYPWRI